MIDLEFVGTILNFFLCRRWLLLGHQVRTANNRIIVKLRERDREHYFSYNCEAQGSKEEGQGI